MFFNPDRVRANVGRADTEDLLDRVTIFRADMEAEALPIIEQELHRRGVTPAQMDAHARQREETTLWNRTGQPIRCSLCPRPAIRKGWGWHRLWGLLPLFPRRFSYCSHHLPGQGPGPATGH
jgi:hypothetical protein